MSKKITVEDVKEFIAKSYSVPEIAEHFGVTKMTVYNWFAEGLPFFRLTAKEARIMIDDAEEWVAKRGGVKYKNMKGSKKK